MNEVDLRREYNPPTVMKIDIHSEEVLAVGCKLNGNQPGFNNLPCVTRTCSQVGS